MLTFFQESSLAGQFLWCKISEILFAFLEQLALTWPVEAPLLNRRRSCELTEKVSPCIEKAATHLYELEDRLLAIRKEIQRNKSNEVKQSPRPGRLNVLQECASFIPNLFPYFIKNPFPNCVIY